MLKQSPCIRNQRTKSFKMKHGFQAVLVLVIATWLLYQLVQHSCDTKKAYEVEKTHEMKRLGRKGMEPWVKKPYEHLMDDEEEESEEVLDLIDEEDNEREEEDQNEEQQ